MKRKTLRSLSWDTTILEGVNDMLKDRVAMSRNLSRLRNKPRGMSLKSEKSCSWDGKKKKKKTGTSIGCKQIVWKSDLQKEM